MALQFEFGSGILTATRNDTLVTGPQTPRRFGALQDVSIEFAGDIKELFSTFQYPIDTARGKTKITGKAKIAEVNTKEYNDIFFGNTTNTGSLKYAFNELATLSAGTPTYTVANNASVPLTDQGVFYAGNTAVSGNQLDIVSSGPGSGQYTFVASTGVYGFSTFDASQPMYFNYTYTVATGHSFTIANQFMGTTPRFSATLFQTFENNQFVMVLNRCISSRLTYPTRIDDYVITDLDFSAFADGSGNVGTINVSQ